MTANETMTVSAIEGRPALAARAVVLNFILFQVGWFACVLGAAQGHAALGTVAAAAIVAFHIARAARPVTELKLVALAVVIGALLDSALPALGLIEYRAGDSISPLAPPWILALWALFATTLNLSLSWLKRRPVLAAALGAIAGPLSYHAGAKLGALTLIQPAAATAALAVEWAIAMTLLVWLARRYDGIAPVRATGT